eukprot:gnl/Dysnectes_brevis/949_a1058_5385.p1 GENE.gnl/Dysnectes_brevis/949_a1058_5385~~gnl/Dysnectes_brevis/949_a1058_5385.p1  ORF type:complete len:265 (+),score=21.19 gnl/Dysnectes_brevis/949_a1058_5385:37-795(+)
MSTLLAGSLAGICGDFVSYPFETLKNNSIINSTSSTQSKQSLKPSHLYRGFSSVLAASVPANAAYFSGYSLTNSLLTKMFPSSTPLVMSSKAFLSGIVADICGSVIWCPLAVVSIRSQSRGTTAKQALTELWKEGGNTPRKLFNGYWLGLMQFAPSIGIRHSMATGLLTKYQETVGGVKQPHNSLSILAAHGISAAVVCMVFTPLDALRVRKQNGDSTTTTSSSKVWSGLLPRIVGEMSGCAVRQWAFSSLL